jgi:ArsR family transcriptional regulator
MIEDMTESTSLVKTSHDYPLSETGVARVESILATIADRTRLRILGIVLAAGGEPVCVCKLVPELGLTQPTVSYHLKQLVGAGLLEREQRGAFAFYSLVPGALAGVSALATALDDVARKKRHES